MDTKEVERYILSLPNVVKKAMHEWKSVRYTIYGSAFATLSGSDNVPKLTVWGRHPEYERAYPRKITPASDNEPRHFSDVYFAEGVPDEVVKEVVNYSYGKRLAQLIRPKSVNLDCGERIRYCGIVSGFAEPNMPVATDGDMTPDEVAATFGIGFDSERDEFVKTDDFSEEIELESSGEWDNMPYSSNAANMKAYAELRKKVRDMSACDVKEKK